MVRILALAYGVAAYLVFLGTFLYAIGFVSGVVVPKTVDTGAPVSTAEALVADILLLSLFAAQHSVMARKPFKRWWTRLVPVPVERSTYVLLASLALIVLFWQWRPMRSIVWQIGNPVMATALQALSFAGWFIVAMSTFLISHFELFGLRQVIGSLGGKALPEPGFRTPYLYKLVRHPLYLGFIIAFWATPAMTAGHLLFAGVTTACILVAIVLVERDLTDLFGGEHRRYQRERVAMRVPGWRKLPRSARRPPGGGAVDRRGGAGAPASVSYPRMPPSAISMLPVTKLESSLAR